jgi:hypothetical protein
LKVLSINEGIPLAKLMLNSKGELTTCCQNPACQGCKSGSANQDLSLLQSLFQDYQRQSQEQGTAHNQTTNQLVWNAVPIEDDSPLDLDSIRESLDPVFAENQRWARLTDTSHYRYQPPPDYSMYADALALNAASGGEVMDLDAAREEALTAYDARMKKRH